MTVQVGDVKDKKYKLVPPDGGWGYVVCVAVVIILTVITIFVPCFGLLYDDFLKDIKMGTTSITLMNGLSGMSLAVCGFLVGFLLKVMSTRQVALIGSLLTSIAACCIIFVNSEPLFLVAQGIILSSGAGILYNIAFIVLNQYFLEKQLLVVTLTQTISAGAAMIAPMLIKMSLYEYGFRGTLTLIAGFMLHAFVASALLQPIARHLKRVEITNEEEAEELLLEIKLLLVEEKKLKENPESVPTVTLTDKEIESGGTVKEKSEKNNDNPSQPDSDIHKGIRGSFSKFIDMALLKSFVLSSPCIGTTISLFVDFNFVILLPQALQAKGWDKAGMAWALTLTSAGDLITRILLIIFNKWLHKVENQVTYLVGVIIGFVTRLGLLWSDNYIVMLTFITLMGISRCTITVLPPLVISEAVGPSRFSEAMGFFMLFFGIICLVLGPAIGAIRDATGSYTSIFYILTSLLGVVSVMWSIELCYKKNKRKRKLQSVITDKSSSLNKIN